MRPFSLAAAMTRATKALLRSHTVPAWAINDASRSRACAVPQKLASIGKGLLRVEDAACLLNVSEKTIRRLIVAGALKCVRIGRLVRIHPAEVERFLAEASHSTAAPVREDKETGRG